MAKKSKVLQPKSEKAWQKINKDIAKYLTNLERYQAATDSKAKERIQDTLRDDGLRIQTFFNEQTRYNTTNTPSAIIDPKTGHAAGQWHHAATQNRILPFFLTVKNQKDFNRLIGALRQYGIATGNSYQNMFDLPIDLHASKNPRAIHRVEEKAGLDEPDRYFKQGGTIDDAIKAVPYLAEDVTGSKRLARDLQYQGMTTGEGSRFSDEVRMTATSESTPEHLRINQEGLQPDLSEQRHKKIGKARQTSLQHVRDRQEGKLDSKTITDANYYVTHGKDIINSPDPEPLEHPREGGTKFKNLAHAELQDSSSMASSVDLKFNVAETALNVLDHMDKGRYGEALIEATTLTPAGRTANLVHSTADSISRASTGQSLAERIADAPRRTDEYFSDESVAARVQKRDEMVQTIKDKTTSITNWLHELVQ